MSNRKTAYSAKIIDIKDIPGKDRIKYATVQAEDSQWNVIVGNDYLLNEKVIYIEYDTIIKLAPWNESLTKRCWNEKLGGQRIRVMKMANLTSYGIVFKAEECITDMKVKLDFYNDPLGTDFSDYLGVCSIDVAEENITPQKPPMSKFERLLKKYGYFIWKLFYFRKPNSKAFPKSVIKTDETRAQNLNYIYEAYQGKRFYSTVKVDGQSATFVLEKGRFKIASRNILKYDQPFKKAQKELIPQNIDKFKDDFISIACQYSIPDIMIKTKKELINFPENIAIQGELAGPSIQGNKLKLASNKLYLFNLFDIDKRRYYNPTFLKKFERYGMDLVPFIEIANFKFKDIKDLEEYAKGIYPLGGPREGVVIRIWPENEIYLPEADKSQNGCQSFKIINPDFAVRGD